MPIITPEIARETSSSSSLSGSQTFRIKFAWAQLNLDQWLTKGSWVRVGINQTPWLDYAESIYHYRFQGTTFVDREGFLFPSDAGITFHYNFPQDFGDVQVGVYNGEGWAHAEVNDQKAKQIRATLRPMPANTALHGLRISGFYDADHYAAGLPRNRTLGQVSYEHPLISAAILVQLAALIVPRWRTLRWTEVGRARLQRAVLLMTLVLCIFLARATREPKVPVVST